MSTAEAVDSPTSLDSDALVERHYAVVYRYAFRLTGCATTAEDIAQETFVRAIEHLGQLRTTKAERGWILTITRREFLRWLRQKSHAAYGQTLGPMSDDACEHPIRDLPSRITGPEQYQQLENHDWLERALASLSAGARMTLAMYYFEEMSYAEIAEQLDVPIGTIMSRLSRSRNQLRQALDQMSGAAPCDEPKRSLRRESAHTGSPGDTERTSLATSESIRVNDGAALGVPIIRSAIPPKSTAQEARHG